MGNTIDEQFEDALSLCDLSFDDNQETQEHPDFSSASTQDFFEFSTSSTSSDTMSTEDDKDIIFCGKVISWKTVDNEDQRKNPVLISTTSLSASKSLAKNKSSNSSPKPASPPRRAKSSLKCSSANSRKHKAIIIGLARIPTKMELSDLRERQNRRMRTLPPMSSPAVVGGEAVDVTGNGRRGKSPWSLLRPFRYRAHDLASLLPKACFGSIWLARPCID